MNKSNTPQQLEIDFGITEEQACILCHLSSGCAGCCVKCKAQGKNGTCYGQTCSRHDLDKQKARWNTWMYLVRTSFPELTRFIPAKYRKQENITIKTNQSK